MASILSWKLYRDGKYMAATRHPEDAAALVSVLGSGATVKCNGRIVWREGQDGRAGESYDGTAAVMMERVRAHNNQKKSTYRANLKEEANGVQRPSRQWDVVDHGAAGVNIDIVRDQLTLQRDRDIAQRIAGDQTGTAR